MGEGGGEDEGREVGEERTEGRSMLEAGQSNLMQHWTLLATSTLLATVKCTEPSWSLSSSDRRENSELFRLHTAEETSLWRGARRGSKMTVTRQPQYMITARGYLTSHGSHDIS